MPSRIIETAVELVERRRRDRDLIGEPSHAKDPS